MPRILGGAFNKKAGIRRQSSSIIDVDTPLGAFSNGVGYIPATNLQHYGYISSAGTAGAAFTGIHAIYRTGITCQPAGTTNIIQSVCLANGWEMRTSGGTVLTNVAHDGVMADPGNPDYQEAWCDASLVKLQALGSNWNALWIDDVNPRPTSLSGGLVPAQYPTNALYEAALASFAEFQRDYFEPLGIKLAWNAGIPQDDNTAQVRVFWPKVAPYLNFLTKEFYLQAGGGSVLRTRSLSWDQWITLHPVLNNLGCGWLPLSGATGGIGGVGGSLQRFGLGSFLLEWTGQADDGFFMFHPTGGWNSTIDPWTQMYADAIALGAPIAPRFASGDLEIRNFQNGTLTVNPVLGTASISLV
jgi:hypothetical protein